MDYAPTAAFPDAAAHFAQLQNNAWGHLYTDASVERSTFDLLNNRYDEPDLTTLRLAWFACNDEGEPLGVAMLVGDGEVEPQDERDLEGPWFAGLVVDPAVRRPGVGAGLLNFVTEQGRSLGFQHLRLVTENKTSFYERRGWSIERVVTLNSVPNTVMFITLES
jgi:GNAT superfamily N-acetyltransferase